MATSSGNTTATTISISSSGSEGYQHPVILDDRKRKRMASNRESARRSRMRKQQHLDDLTAQIAQLRRENDQIAEATNLTTQQFLNVESDNSVLRAQMTELSQRLDSLNGMINDMNALSGIGSMEGDSLGMLGHGMGDFGIMNGYFGNFTQSINNHPWNLGYLNQPIMASADVLHY